MNHFIGDVTLGTVYLSFISDKDLSEKLLIAIIPELVLSLSSISLIVLSSYTLYGKIDFILLKQAYPIQTDFAAQAIYIIMFSFLAFISRKRKLVLSSLQKYFFCAILVVCRTLLSSVSTLILVDRMDDNHIAFSIIYLFVIIILLYIIFYDLTVMNRKQRAAELDKTLLEAQLSSTEKILKAQKELQKLHHDVKHILKSLDTVDKDEVTQKLIDQFNQNVIPIETGSIALNAVLNTYRQEAANKHIDFSLILNLSEQTPLNNEDLCLLVSNLLDNAIVHIGSRRIIRAELQSTADQFMIRIQNSIDLPVLHQDNTFRYGTDSEHGYGIRTVQAVVNKYNGKLFYDENESDFAVMAVIPQKPLVKNLSVD